MVFAVGGSAGASLSRGMLSAGGLAGASHSRGLPSIAGRGGSRLASAGFLFLALCNCGIAQDLDATAAARVLEQALVDCIADAERSVAAIARIERPPGASPPVRILDPFALPGGDGGENPRSRNFIPDHFGSGMIVADDQSPDERYVLTTYHVAYGENRPSEDGGGAERNVKVFVRLAGGEVIEASAEPKAADWRSDLAVLRLDLEAAGVDPTDVVPIEFGSGEDLKKGRLVVVLGNPYAQARDGSASASMGMISNTSRRPMPPDDARGLLSDDASIHHFGTLLQIDSRLNLGTSGGLVVNLDGEAIGLTTSLAALRGYESSVGYAIPFDEEMLKLIADLIAGYELEYGFLGIHPRTVGQNEATWDREEYPQATAVRVAELAGQSPAEEAGLERRDIILSINGREVVDDIDLMRQIGLLGPDAEAELTVWREREEAIVRLRARLGKWPVYDDTKLVITATRYPEWRGIQVDYPTARKKYMPSDPLSVYRRAVVVTSVAEGSPADEAGLRVGDFIEAVQGAHVERPAEFHAASADEAGPLTLKLLDGSRKTVGP